MPLQLWYYSTVKVIPQQAEVAQGVPSRLRPRIFLTFRHYKGGRLSAKRTGRLYPRRNSWYSLSAAESTSGHMVLSGEPRKKSPVTPPGIDPGTVRLVAQRLNHYATPGGKGGRCVRLTTLPPSCAVVMKSGNLNFLEPSGPLQTCNGTALPFFTRVHIT